MLMTKYAVHYNIKGVYCSVSTEQGQMIKQHTYIGFLERKSHGENDTQHVGVVTTFKVRT